MAHKVFTFEVIKREFDRFFAETGHWPTSQEMDSVHYLPTAKTIQRTYGSIEKLRKLLGLPILNYSKGEARSEKAKVCNERSFLNEEEVLSRLVKKFGRTRVHAESPMSSQNHFRRCDFEIFSEKGESMFCIDVFYPESIKNLLGCVNIKSKIYTQFPRKIVYFVCMNPAIPQLEIDARISNKKNPIPSNMKVFSIDSLDKYI